MWKKIGQVSDGVVNLLSLALLLYIAILLRSQIHVPTALKQGLNPGQTLQIKNLDWHRKQHTLLFALQTSCHFCAESAPFYRELLKQQSTSDWQAVAILPQPTDKARTYMQSEGYVIPEVRQMDLGAIGVSGTPTLLLVNQNGKLEKRWVGKLTGTQEDEVATALGLARLPHYQQASLTTEEEQEASSLPQVSETEEIDPLGTNSVRVDRALRGSPVSIVGLFDGNRDIAPFLHDAGLSATYPYRYRMWDRVPFQGDDDWLANLIIVVKNVSSKEIIAGSLDIRFPQTGSGAPSDPMAIQTISMGRRPDVKPGEELRFTLQPYVGKIKASIGRPISAITTCQILFDYFYFSDGTRWASFAGFQKPEMSVPGKYVRITADEFNRQTEITN